MIRPDITGEYEFSVGGDDGYRLFIDNELVADQWEIGSFRNSSVKKRLEAGKEYDIRFEYFQEGGGAAVALIWEYKGEKRDPFVERLDRADMVIACFGHSSDTEGEGADRTFALPDADAKMITRALKCKRPVVGVVNAGGNVEMQAWEPGLKGLLWGWYAGQESGTAVADILFGNVNPSGKLPMTLKSDGRIILLMIVIMIRMVINMLLIQKEYLLVIVVMINCNARYNILLVMVCLIRIFAFPICLFPIRWSMVL